jgi:LemA protein
MKKGLFGCLGVGIVLAVVALLLGGWAMGKYNGLVAEREKVNTAWSQVENQYQRRYDLIPNLVETVKGAANFEKETYIAVTEARAKVGQAQISAKDLDNPEAFRKLEAAQGELSSALSRLLVVAENYPELKANANFLDLQSQLEGTENRISTERGRFNEAAQAYNSKLKQFPTNIVGGMFGFVERPYFTSVDGAATPPKVQF